MMKAGSDITPPENSDDIHGVGPVEAVHDQLMCSRNKCETVPDVAQQHTISDVEKRKREGDKWKMVRLDQMVGNIFIKRVQFKMTGLSMNVCKLNVHCAVPHE